MSSRRTLLVTLAVFLAPMLVELALTGARWSFGYLAGDSFYYLTVARNMAEHASVSFDGLRPTNGFHPLWQGLLALVYGVAELLRISEPHILILTVLLNAALVAWALVLIARALREVPSLFVLVPLGLYSLAVSVIWIFGSSFGMNPKNIDEEFPPLYGTLWSYCNGMESSLVVLFFAAALERFVREDRGTVALALLLSGVTLARLDHGIIAASILLWLFVSERKIRPQLAFAAPLGLYLVVNKLYCGMWFPVSGRLKSTFPHVNRINLSRLADTFLHPLGQGWWRIYREAQEVLPALVALLVLILWRQKKERFDRFLLYASPGVLALGLYNLLYVDIWEQGHWYFPVSTLYVSLIGLRLFNFDRKWLVPAGALVSLLFFVRYQHRPPYHQRLADVYFIDAPALKKLYPEPPKLYEYEDGIFAFATGFPSLATKGYTLDKEAYRELRKGKLTPLALARGHERFVSTTFLGLTNDSSLADRRLLHIPDEAKLHIEYQRGLVRVVRVWIE